MKTSFQTEVENLRIEIAGLVDEIAWTADAPLPREEVKQRIAAVAKAAAEKFNLDMLRMANPRAGAREFAELFTLHDRVRIRGEGVGIEPVTIDLSGLLAAAVGDDLIKRLCKQVDALDYVAGPPVKDRSAVLAKLRDSLRDLEMREEKLICEAEAAGVYIARREDADPAIVLAYDPAGELSELRLPGRSAAGGLVAPAAA